MAHQSPLTPLQQRTEALLRTYGPPDAGVQLVEAWGPVELEYAAIRKSAALLDLPHRATLEVSGDERIEFLNRMLTQELKDLTQWSSTNAFWLNRKGRIEADLRLTELGDRLHVDLDAHVIEGLLDSLGSYIFAEDVELLDRTEQLHRLALHGPRSIELLANATAHFDGPQLGALQPGTACIVTFEDQQIVVERVDSTGEIGLELTLMSGVVARLFERLAADPDADGPLPDDRARPAGWHAFNLARMEAGTALFMIDFGPDTLPHETGVLRDHVSFTKGCYLGQEVVARMESLGRPKQRLVGLRPTVAGRGAGCPQPVSGAQVFKSDDAAGEIVGVVTSSAISPMLGAEPVCFAMLRSNHAEPGTEVTAPADGERLNMTVQDSLRFWNPT